MSDLKVGEITIREEERIRTEIYTRVMGYHRPISEFNIGKRQEHADRRHFRESCIDTKHKYVCNAVTA